MAKLLESLENEKTEAADCNAVFNDIEIEFGRVKTDLLEENTAQSRIF